MNVIPKLTEAQTLLVENRLQEDNDLVRVVLLSCFTPNKYVPELSYEELYQVGCIGLCVAARKYNGSVTFDTFASVVIRNHIYDYARKSADYVNHISRLHGSECMEATVDFIEELSYKHMRALLAEQHKKLSGCAKKGLIALELRLTGHTPKQIADLFGENTKTVAAWISKAKKKLVNDDDFLCSLSDIDTINSYRKKAV